MHAAVSQRIQYPYILPQQWDSAFETIAMLLNKTTPRLSKTSMAHIDDEIQRATASVFEHITVDRWQYVNLLQALDDIAFAGIHRMTVGTPLCQFTSQFSLSSILLS
jgi:hypothetical protein